MNEIVSLIGSLGFPIVMCLLCLWFSYKLISELSTQIKANTQAIISLKEFIESRGVNSNEISNK